MRTERLIYARDSESGEMGFRIRGVDIEGMVSVDAGDGVVTAHDLMEHPNGLA